MPEAPSFTHSTTKSSPISLSVDNPIATKAALSTINNHSLKLHSNTFLNYLLDDIISKMIRESLLITAPKEMQF